MNFYCYSLFISVVFVLFHIISVNCCLRFLQRLPPILIHFLSALIYLILLIFLFIFTRSFDLWLAVCGLGFGVSSYLFIFGAIYKSLSLQMLLFTKVKGSTISIDEVHENITQKSFQDRANLLIKMGCCYQDDAGYHLTTKGKKILSRILWVRRVFCINSLGLY